MLSPSGLHNNSIVGSNCCYANRSISNVIEKSHSGNRWWTNKEPVRFKNTAIEPNRIELTMLTVEEANRARHYSLGKYFYFTKNDKYTT